MSLESIAGLLWAMYKNFTEQIGEKIDYGKTYSVNISGEDIWSIYKKSQWLYKGLKEIEG